MMEPPPPVVDPSTTFDSNNPELSTHGAPNVDMDLGDVVGGNSSGLTGGSGSGTIDSAVPAIEEKPADNDNWDFWFGSRGKQAVPAAPVEEPIPESAPELAKEDDAWGSGPTTFSSKKKKKGKKGKNYRLEEAEVEPTPPPEPAPLPVHDDWGSFASADAKKKDNRRAEEEVEVEEPASPPLELEPELEPEPVEEEPPPRPAKLTSEPVDTRLPAPEPAFLSFEESPGENSFTGRKKSNKQKILERRMQREAEAKAKEEE